MSQSYLIQDFLSNLTDKEPALDLLGDDIINRTMERLRNEFIGFLQGSVDYPIDPNNPRVIWEAELPPTQYHNGLKIYLYDDGTAVQEIKPILPVSYIMLNLRITRDGVSFETINQET